MYRSILILLFSTLMVIVRSQAIYRDFSSFGSTLFTTLLLASGEPLGNYTIDNVTFRQANANAPLEVTNIKVTMTRGPSFATETFTGSNSRLTLSTRTDSFSLFVYQGTGGGKACQIELRFTGRPQPRGPAGAEILPLSEWTSVSGAISVQKHWCSGTFTQRQVTSNIASLKPNPTLRTLGSTGLTPFTSLVLATGEPLGNFTVDFVKLRQASALAPLEVTDHKVTMTTGPSFASRTYTPSNSQFTLSPSTDLTFFVLANGSPCRVELRFTGDPQPRVASGANIAPLKEWTSVHGVIVVQKHWCSGTFTQRDTISNISPLEVQ